MHTPKLFLAVGAFALVVLGPSAAPAQNPYARVTIANQTDVAIVFDAGWEGQAAREFVVEPGKAVTAETAFPPGPTRPNLTVRYRQWRWMPRITVELASGHVDPRTDNPGRVYDFYRKRTNEGPMLQLSPR
jgi:hypothetical protein